MVEEHVECIRGKNCCIMKSMSSTIEFISLNTQITK